jgi:hypothetical protein
MKNYGKLTTALIVVWFIFVLSGSALHLFKADPNSIASAVGIAAVAPLAVFALWVTASKEFRQFLLGLNPELLTAAQTWRIVGFTFVLLEAHGVLPAVFALPAGYGDMFIGLSAAFAAWKLATPRYRNAFILWQLLGITDLVVAVILGTTAVQIDPHGPSTAPMSVLPLSLIPTFLVPLFVMLHLICIAQARSWKIAAQSTGQTTTAPLHHPTI